MIDVLPRVQRFVAYSGVFELDSNIPIVCNNAAIRSDIGDFIELLEEREPLGFEISRSNDVETRAVIVKVVSRLPEAHDNLEGYRLSVGCTHITVEGISIDGLRHGLQTLREMIYITGDRRVVPCCIIIDWPDSRWRGFMVDPARSFIPVSRLKWIIWQMARAKLNRLHIHFSDSEAFALYIEKYSELGMSDDGDKTRVYSRADIQELVEYAHRLGIEIIPEVEMPGHNCRLLRVFPELKCKTSGDNASDWNICIGSEKTYEFIADVLEEVTAIFPSEVLHIGGDEVEFKDNPKIYASWHECEVCRERMIQEGISDKQELFYYFVRRVHEILKSKGRRMMMFNDNIDISKSPEIPRDILVHFWRIAAEGRGPRDGCSLARFLEEGFEVVNSHYPETYIDLYVEEMNLASWSPVVRPFVPAERIEQVLGGEMCAWDNHWDYYPRVLPSAILMFGDRVWHWAPVEDLKAMRVACTRQILGKNTPEGFDLFSALGGMILPLNSELKAHNVFSSDEECNPSDVLHVYTYALEILTCLYETDATPDPETIKEYIESIKWLMRRDAL